MALRPSRAAPRARQTVSLRMRSVLLYAIRPPARYQWNPRDDSLSHPVPRHVNLLGAVRDQGVAGSNPVSPTQEALGTPRESGGPGASSFTVREWAAPPARHAARARSLGVWISWIPRVRKSANFHDRDLDRPCRDLPPLGIEPSGEPRRTAVSTTTCKVHTVVRRRRSLGCPSAPRASGHRPPWRAMSDHAPSPRCGERGHVDDEAVAHVLAYDPIVGPVDPSGRISSMSALMLRAAQ